MSATEKPRPQMLERLAPFWKPQTGIFLCLWLALMAVGQSRLLRDPGTFWHTEVGRRMLTSGHLVYVDPFGFAPPDQPWIPHQWLGECLMALIHGIAGLDSLLLATATILACLYTWLAGRLMSRGLHWSLAVAIMLLVIAASSHHFHIRSHIATIAFMGVTFAFLCDFEAGRIGLRRLVWLVPLYLFWTSVHGGMVGGLATMGLALGGWTVFRLLRLDSPVRSVKDFLLLAGLIALCAATAVVNPYGTALPRIWQKIMVDSPVLPQIIQEHAPLALWDSAGQVKPESWMILLLAGVYLFGLAGITRLPRVTWLLPLAWLYLSLGRIRHAPLFAITAGLAFAEILPHTRWMARLARSGSDLFQPVADDARPKWDWRPLLLPVLAVLLALTFEIAEVKVPVVGSDWAHPDTDIWPEPELVARLKQIEASEPPGTPIFNDLNYGGFLMYEMPGLRIFIDDRCELYGDARLVEYHNAEFQDTTACMARWQKAHPFHLALVHAGSGYDRWFQSAPGWHLEIRTPTAALYRLRNTRADKAETP